MKRGYVKINSSYFSANKIVCIDLKHSNCTTNTEVRVWAVGSEDPFLFSVSEMNANNFKEQFLEETKGEVKE